MPKAPHINPDTYMLIDRVTGEEVNIKLFIEEVQKDHWEKAYANVLAEYIEAPGEKSSRILAYLIRNRNHENIVIGSCASIASELKISKTTVHKILKILQDKKLIKQIKNGVYMVSPKMIRYGSHNAGVALMVLWEK